MKAVLLFMLSAICAWSQTNEFRLINGALSDVNSTNWITVTIPAGSALRNALAVQFDGTLKPQHLFFQIPAIYNFNEPTVADVFNFPYTPALFRSGQVQTGITVGWEKDFAPVGNRSHQVKTPVLGYGLVLKKNLTMRVYALSHAKTVYDAVGNATVVPASPHFDYGIVEAPPIFEPLPPRGQPN